MNWLGPELRGMHRGVSGIGHGDGGGRLEVSGLDVTSSLRPENPGMAFTSSDAAAGPVPSHTHDAHASDPSEWPSLSFSSSLFRRRRDLEATGRRCELTRCV